MSRIKKIKTKLYLHTPLKAVHMLDGAYEAVTRGQSMDFEELRNYSRGDRRKDIDWKSSARANNLLVKQYIAAKRVPVEFVVDTGRSMVAMSPDNEPKSEIAANLVATFGYLALRHGDTVGAITGTGENVKVFPQGGTENHLERILQAITPKTNPDASDIFTQLNYLLTHISRRRIVIIITGLLEPDEETTDIIKKLKRKHDVLWLVVDDFNPFTNSNVEVQDVDTGATIPKFLQKQKKLKEDILIAEQARVSTMENFLRKLQVPYIHATTSDNVINDTIELLNRRKNERRHR